LGIQKQTLEGLMMWRSLACIALLFAGCAATGAQPNRDRLPAYADGMEYHVPTNRGTLLREQAATTGLTYYFHVNTRRVCYSFQVPGTWAAGREAGVLRRLDGKGLLGVSLLNMAELSKGSVEDAISKAAERSDQLYAKERGGTPSILAPYPNVAGAWHWKVPVEGSVSDRPGTVVRIVPRWYLPVADVWIAQFAIGAPADADADTFVSSVLTSLTISREPRCYEPRLRELGAVR
jgi:hypothetical protein